MALKPVLQKKHVRNNTVKFVPEYAIRGKHLLLYIIFIIKIYIYLAKAVAKVNFWCYDDNVS